MPTPVAAMLCLLAVVVANPGAAAGEERAGAISQDIAVTLVPADHLLKGESTITYDALPATLTFDINPATRIEAVTSGNRVLRSTFSDGKIAVSPESAKGERSITIRYSLVMNDPLPDQGTGTEDPSYGISGIVSVRGVFLDSSAGWYPRPSRAPGRRTFRITAPAGMEAITSGERIARETSGGTTWSVWRESPSVGDAALAAGPYRVKERNLPGLLITTYLYSGNSDLADTYLDAAGSYLQRFSDVFGPYPFAKFAVVENFFPTGYGFPSYTLLGSTVIRLPFITTTSLPHEIAHNWWGNGVLVGPRQGNWCEGLVTYVADYMQEERKGGAAGRDYRLRLLSDYALLVPAGTDFPLKNFSSRIDPASRAIGYGKSAMIWHMLRRRVGDQAFFDSLRDLFREKRFQPAEWDDFSRALSRRSGHDITTFVNTWISTPGAPSLKFQDVRIAKEGNEWAVTGKVEQKVGRFPLLLPLRLESASDALEQTLPITGAETAFHFMTRDKPGRLLLDPDVDTFRLLSPDQLPANVNRLKGSRRLLGVVTAGCPEPAALPQLLESLGQEGVKVVQEAELQEEEVEGRDVVFCGLPSSGTSRFNLPPDIQIAERGFTVDGRRFTHPEHLLFLVASQQRRPGRVAALLLPLSSQAAEAAVYKITHYGNFATLVFEGGINRYKGRAGQHAAGDEVIITGDEQ